MVFVEQFADVVEVRPGRRLFVRKVSIGTKAESPDNNTTTATWQLICLHGSLGTEKQYQLLLQSMDHLLQLKSDGEEGKKRSTGSTVSCLLFDSVGCGQSPAILHNWDAYNNDEIELDLQAVIEQHANPTLPTIVMCHSYAPSIFLSLLQRSTTQQPQQLLLPHLVGCILLSTAVRCEQLPLPDGGLPIMRFLPVVLLQCIQKQLTEGFIQLAVHPDHVALKDAIRNDSNKNNMYVAKAYHRHHKWCTASHLSALDKIPTLIIHGANDGIIPIECGQYLHHQLDTNAAPSKFVVMDRASHMVMLEQHEKVAQEVIQFLTTLP